jgi:hypothetical protein
VQTNPHNKISTNHGRPLRLRRRGSTRSLVKEHPRARFPPMDLCGRERRSGEDYHELLFGDAACQASEEGGYTHGVFVHQEYMPMPRISRLLLCIILYMGLARIVVVSLTMTTMIMWYQNYENASYEITQSTSICWGGVGCSNMIHDTRQLVARGGRL